MSRPEPAKHPIGYLRPHRGGVIAGILALAITNGLVQTVPWLVKQTIEAIEAVVKRGADSRAVIWLSLAIICVAVLQALIRILSRILIFNVGRHAEYELRREVFAHLCTLDGEFYRRFRTGDLMSRLTNDLAAVRALFGPGILQLVNTAFAYLIALPLMWRIDPTMTLLSLAPYPLLLLGARQFAGVIFRRSRAQQQALATMTSAVQEDLGGIRELKNYRLESLRGELFARSSTEYRDQAIRLALWRGAMTPFVGAGTGTSLVLLLWVGGQRVIDQSLSLGDLVALNLYVAALAWPTLAIGWMLSMWQRGIAAWQRLRELLCQTSSLSDGPGVEDDSWRPSSALRVQRLSLRAANDKQLLADVSFAVPSGTICGLVGRVGSGKTTLVELIARLLATPENTIYFGDRDVTTLPLATIRRQIAYAPQDPFLFSATLADNIAYGISDQISGADRQQRIANAVVAAGLSEDLTRLPNGLETMVGERGISLSGGQRQRVALARALAAGRPFLILDDSLSAVDAETERQILSGLRQVLDQTTTLLISHRLSALQHADQVIVLEQGRLVQQGPPNELMRIAGPYANLYRQQLLDQELAELSTEER
ncbi:MAG: ABC transporter ATP-binding protein [Deltaproteobacteria bacterium]|nr:ABC transporter ATP-binding protein [Deltaproteobacteria bacterium]